MLMLIAVFHVTLSPAFYSCPSKSKVIWAFACKQVKWTVVFEEKHLKCIGCTCSLIENVWTYIGIHCNYLCNEKSPETIMICCRKIELWNTLFLIFAFIHHRLVGWLPNADTSEKFLLCREISQNSRNWMAACLQHWTTSSSSTL